jgi:multicomponent Na+:H+ antiporter subunit E
MEIRRSTGFRMRAILHRAALFGAIWAALVAGDGQGLLMGLVIVPLAVWLSLGLIPPRNPMDLWRTALHLPRFIWGSVEGGVDVARRAFAPDMRLSPDWLVVPLNLPEGARAVLGAELSLMPGSLAAGVDGESLLVHRLTSENDQTPREIAMLEAQITSMLEGPPKQSGKAA